VKENPEVEMAVHFYTPDSRDLLGRFRSAINQTELEGKITTWQQWRDSDYFTHTSPQWRFKAFMKAAADSEKLTFYIVNTEGRTVSSVDYGFYHGHLIETFLNHFDRLFRYAQASALPEQGDVIE
jgi:hypothetical protein